MKKCSKSEYDFLSEKESLILHTVIMRMTEKESLEYLAKHDVHIKPRAYYNYKKKLRESGEAKANHIAIKGFLEQHIQRIYTFETIEREFWSCYVSEPDPYKKTIILSHIAKFQPALTTLYGLVQRVMERQASTRSAFSNDSTKKN